MTNRLLADDTSSWSVMQRRQSTSMKTGVAHEENFPVASWLCPPKLRPVIGAIYWFARTADDLADEGNAPADKRLADLAAYRDQLKAAADAAPGWQPDQRWASIFTPLARHIQAHQLPVNLLHDLLSAFEQDVHRTAEGRWYDTHDELLAYCQLSANPVGRLLLHLYGVNDPQRLAESDHICTALQLINFWQDLSVDLPRRRYYLPVSELTRVGLSPADVLPGTAREANTQKLSELIANLVEMACGSMQKGIKLPLHIPGRAGWELRLVVQGGLSIARQTAHLSHHSLHTRPKLSALQLPRLLWHAVRMG